MLSPWSDAPVDAGSARGRQVVFGSVRRRVAASGALWLGAVMSSLAVACAPAPPAAAPTPPPPESEAEVAAGLALLEGAPSEPSAPAAEPAPTGGERAPEGEG